MVEIDNVRIFIECDICREQEEKIQKLGVVKYKLPSIGLYVVEIRASDLPKLRGIEGIKSVHPNTHITAQLYSSKKTICSEKNQYTGKGVTVAILDTGVTPVYDLTYPKNRILAFKDFINDKKEPYDDNAHGTHVGSSYSYH